MADDPTPPDPEETAAAGAADASTPSAVPTFTPPAGAVPLDPVTLKPKADTAPKAEATPKGKEKAKEEKPKESKPVRKRRSTFGIILLLVCCTTAAWIGSLSLHNKGVAKSQTSFKVYRGPTQAEDALKQLRSAIASARIELIVAAKQINNRPILEAILDRYRNGVKVILILDGTDEKTKTTIAFLLKEGFNDQRLLATRKPFESQTVLVDGKYVVTGSMPFNSEALAKSSELTIYFNPLLAKELKSALELQIKEDAQSR